MTKPSFFINQFLHAVLKGKFCIYVLLPSSSLWRVCISEHAQASGLHISVSG